MKKVILCVVFCSIFVNLLSFLNEIIIPKQLNRYYILDKHLEKIDQNFDIQIYGSCHSYTSFNPMYLKENYNLDSYVYGNPGEIIPVTYLRMLNNFKKDLPDIVFLEIWGINPYETYDTTENILENYLPPNLEILPLTKEKYEVIKDYNLNFLEMNLPLYKYKDRIMNNFVYENDFNYTLEGTKIYSTDYIYSEMVSRLDNNGFKVYPSQDVSMFPKEQSVIEEDDYLEIEPDIVKYLKKIIELCKENNVELIFYRSPYISTKNELKKLKHFKEIVKEYKIEFVDLEEMIKYNYKKDFYDKYHLSEEGANKSTKYLAEKFLISE